MAKLQRTQLFPSITTIKDPATKNWAERLMQFLDEVVRKIAAIPFNQSDILTVADSGSADTEFALTHYLGRIPNGFVVTLSDKACSVYDSGTTWTTTAVYLKCDAANVALSIMVF